MLWDSRNISSEPDPHGTSQMLYSRSKGTSRTACEFKSRDWKSTQKKQGSTPQWSPQSSDWFSHITTESRDISEAGMADQVAPLCPTFSHSHRALPAMLQMLNLLEALLTRREQRHPCLQPSAWLLLQISCGRIGLEQVASSHSLASLLSRVQGA